jgi:hypothetical protein
MRVLIAAAVALSFAFGGVYPVALAGETKAQGEKMKG